MKYIESLREGERINEIYLCKVKQSALTKAGKPYDNLILQDKTGTLDAKIWEPGSVGIDEFDSLDYIAVMGDITSFQGNLQLNVKRVRKVQEGEYDPCRHHEAQEELRLCQGAGDFRTVAVPCAAGVSAICALWWLPDPGDGLWAAALL